MSSLITFANSLDSDQDRSKLVDTTLIVFLKEGFENVHFEKMPADDNKNTKKIPSMQRVTFVILKNKVGHIPEIFFFKVDVEKISIRHKGMKNYPECKELKENKQKNILAD